MVRTKEARETKHPLQPIKRAKTGKIHHFMMKKHQKTGFFAFLEQNMRLFDITVTQSPFVAIGDFLILYPAHESLDLMFDIHQAPIFFKKEVVFLKIYSNKGKRRFLTLQNVTDATLKNTKSNKDKGCDKMPKEKGCFGCIISQKPPKTKEKRAFLSMPSSVF